MKKMCPVLILLAAAGCGNNEPLYQGQPLDAWIQAATHTDLAIRKQAILELQVIKTKDKRIVPKLSQLLKNGHFSAAETLGELAPLGDQDQEAVTALLDAVKSPSNNISVRFAAARALPKFGPAANAALPILIQMLKEDNAEVRRQAAETLGNLQQSTPEVMTALQAAASDSNAVVARTAADALRKLDPKKWGAISKSP